MLNIGVVLFDTDDARMGAYVICEEGPTVPIAARASSTATFDAVEKEVRSMVEDGPYDTATVHQARTTEQQAKRWYDQEPADAVRDITAHAGRVYEVTAR